MSTLELTDAEKKIGFNLAGLPEERWLLRVIVGLGCWVLMVIPAVMFWSGLRLIDRYYELSLITQGIDWRLVNVVMILSMSMGWGFGGYLMCVPERRSRSRSMAVLATIIRITTLFFTLILLVDTAVYAHAYFTDGWHYIQLLFDSGKEWVYPFVMRLFWNLMFLLLGGYLLSVGRRVNMPKLSITIACLLCCLVFYHLVYQCLVQTVVHEYYYYGYDRDLWNQMALVFDLLLIIPAILMLVFIIRLIKVWRMRPSWIEDIQAEIIHSRAAGTGEVEADKDNQEQVYIATISRDPLKAEMQKLGYGDHRQDQGMYLKAQAIGFILVMLSLILFWLMFPMGDLWEPHNLISYEPELWMNREWTMVLWMPALTMVLLAIVYLSKARPGQERPKRRYLLLSAFFLSTLGAVVISGRIYFFPVERQWFSELETAPIWPVVLALIWLSFHLSLLMFMGLRHLGCGLLSWLQFFPWLVMSMISVPVVALVSNKYLILFYEYNPTYAWVHDLIYEVDDELKLSLGMMTALAICPLLFVLSLALMRVRGLHRELMALPAAQNDEGISIDPS